MKRWGDWENTTELQREGGQARVFIVRDTTGKNAGLFALKELKNPKRQSRFEREILAVKAISGHANVISLVDPAVHRDGDVKPYFVMERADQTLSEWIEKHSGDFQKIFVAVDQICNGLAHIHSNDIIHRDLKPENILFLDQIAKIGDLGICLVRDAIRLTDTSEAVGPRLYMAPELEDGINLDVRPRADIYSLGKVLYFMLSGGVVFSREKLFDPKYSLSKRLKDHRFKAFDRILRGSIEADSQRRIQTVLEFQKVFKACRDAFNSHPRTTLLRAFPDIAETIKSAPANVVGAATEEEVNELIQIVNEREIDLPVATLAEISSRVGTAAVETFIELLARKVEITLDELQIIACRIVRSRASVSAIIHSRHRELSDSILKIAAGHGSKEVLNSVVEGTAIFMKHRPDLAKAVSVRYEELSEERRVSALFGIMEAKFDGSIEFYKSLLNKPDLSILEWEGVLSGIARLGDSQHDATLIECGSRALTEEQRGAFFRAMIFLNSPERLNRIADQVSNSELSKLLKYLGTVNKKAD